MVSETLSRRNTAGLREILASHFAADILRAAPALALYTEIQKTDASRLFRHNLTVLRPSGPVFIILPPDPYPGSGF